MYSINPMQLIQMIKGGQNPQQLMLSILQGQAGTPIGANLLKLVQNGQSEEIEKIVRNLYTQQGGTNFDEDFWTYLQVEKSQMGAWQVYLMSQMWHYLPLQWHANYSYRDYLYSQSSKGYGYFRKNFVASWHKLAPQITQEGDKYLISACYWSEFEGLVREHYAVTFEKDRVYIDKIDVDVLFKYDCGIQF